MSSPQQFAIESQNIGYGFLASSLANALGSTGTTLDQGSKDRLSQGADFLREIIQGAEVVYRGQSEYATEKSIRALGYALEPISALREVVSNDQDFIKIFEEIAKYLDDCAEKGEITADSPNETHQLERARAFFGTVAERILSSLSTLRMRGALDAA